MILYSFAFALHPRRFDAPPHRRHLVAPESSCRQRRGGLGSVIAKSVLQTAITAANENSHSTP